MDDDSAQVTLSLQLGDLNRLLGTSVQAADSINKFDGRIALISYRDEVAARLSFIQDRRMGQSIARAVVQDESTLQQARSQENGAIRDRTVACQMGGLRNGSCLSPLIDLTDDTNDLVMTGYAHLNEAIPEETDQMEIDTPHQETSVQHTWPEQNISPISAGKCPETVKSFQPMESILGVQKMCVSCYEGIHYFKAVYAPCGHDYCQNCAKRLFLNSTRDESLSPPRCCRQAIPLAAVDIFLTAQFIKSFQEKAVEFSTPNRLYCASLACSAFIPPVRINGDTAICPMCQLWVCTMCKGRTHRGRDCPKDESLNALISTASKEGWQRCDRCKRYVELMHGCNHITSVIQPRLYCMTANAKLRCPCSAEFCYVCARPWKTCLCPIWDEQRLVDRANAVAGRQPVPPAPNQRQIMVENIRRNIRDYHECNDHDWRRRRGGDRCEGCELDFPHFIYSCTRCHLLACSACRYQRF